MNKIINHDRTLCEKCKEVQATDLYESYSSIEEGNVFRMLMCENCYVETCILEWEQ